MLSINRFEGKKDVALAIDALAILRSEGNHGKLRLIIAGECRVKTICQKLPWAPRLPLDHSGGYDARLQDNVSTLSSLRKLGDKHKLQHYTYNASSSTAGSTRTDNLDKATPPASPVDILFLLNMTTEQKAILLSPSLRDRTGVQLLLYTPSYEHFGIVPLEAMASSLPVIATNTGGPTETILDRGLEDKTTTGLLCSPDKQSWARAITSLLALPASSRQAIGHAGRLRVKDKFSRQQLGQEIEKACRDAVVIGKPIWTEVGFKKMLAFVIIGGAVLSVGVCAYIYGKYRGWK